MRSLVTVIAVLAGAPSVAAAAPGVAEEAPGQAPTPFPLVIGAHAGYGRIADSAEGSTANGYGPWLDAELGATVVPRLAVLAFAGYAHDSADFNANTTTTVTFTHLLAGARLQYEVSPIAWVGVGVAYMRSRLAFTGVSATTHQPVADTDSKSSPALELRAGIDAARVGRLRFQVIADGTVFLPDSNGGFASTIATLSIGAQFR